MGVRNALVGSVAAAHRQPSTGFDGVRTMCARSTFSQFSGNFSGSCAILEPGRRRGTVAGCRWWLADRGPTPLACGKRVSRVVRPLPLRGGWSTAGGQSDRVGSNHRRWCFHLRLWSEAIRNPPTRPLPHQADGLIAEKKVPSEADLPTERTQAGQEARLSSSHVHQGRALHHLLPSAQGPGTSVGVSELR